MEDGGSWGWNRAGGRVRGTCRREAPGEDGEGAAGACRHPGPRAGSRQVNRPDPPGVAGLHPQEGMHLWRGRRPALGRCVLRLRPGSLSEGFALVTVQVTQGEAGGSCGGRDRWTDIPGHSGLTPGAGGSPSEAGRRRAAPQALWPPGRHPSYQGSRGRGSDRASVERAERVLPTHHEDGTSVQLLTASPIQASCSFPRPSRLSSSKQRLKSSFLPETFQNWAREDPASLAPRPGNSEGRVLTTPLSVHFLPVWF